MATCIAAGRYGFLRMLLPVWSSSWLRSRVIYLFLQKRKSRRGLALGFAVPAMFVSAQALFMLWIPSMFLIENDTASDTGSWPIECAADDAWIVGVATPHRALGESVTEVLIQTSKADYGVLSIPGCMVTPLGVAQADTPARWSCGFHAWDRLRRTGCCSPVLQAGNTNGYANVADCAAWS